MEDALGSKASRGNICLAHDASTDGGINAEWIWNITEEMCIRDRHNVTRRSVLQKVRDHT